MPTEDRRLTPSNYNRDEPLVSRRFQTIQGRDVGPGDPLHPAPEGMDELPVGVRMKLWLTARAVYAKDFTPTPVIAAEAEARLLVKVEPTGGGWHLITAPWMPEGEKVKGKDAAEARADEIRAYGDPKGVTVSGGEGGWYEITAAWLTEAEKVQGHDAAEARAADLRAAGPPDGFDPNAGPVTMLIGSDKFDDSYTIGDDEVQLGTIVAAAQEASGHDPAQWNELDPDDRDSLIQAELDRRSEAVKAPAGTGTDGQGGTEEVKTEGDTGGAGGAAADSGGANDETAPAADFTVTEAGGGWYHITGPGIDDADPVKVQGADDRDAKLAELRQAAGIKAETPAAGE